MNETRRELTSMPDQPIYFDHAATSWPKPPEVVQAMCSFLEEVGANPGRSGHRASIEAARRVYATREALAECFHAADPLRVVFTANVTEALNLALYGLLRPGDHVITSSIEHNALMRPLRFLEQQGVQLDVLANAPDGTLSPGQVEEKLRPETALVALTHASNVCGTILPVTEVGEICRRHGILFLVDSAQTAGVLPINLEQHKIDLLAFTGHKALLGPTGTGGLVLGEQVDPGRLAPLKRGGTGSHSEFELQPDFLPDRYESGTLNAVGLAGLGAGVRWLLNTGIQTIRQKEMALCQQVIDGLAEIEGVQLYGPQNAALQTATVAFNLSEMQPSEAGYRLDEEYHLYCRVGLHCAPAAHRTLGTFPKGCVRWGLGASNTAQEVEFALKAIRTLAQEKKR